MSADYGLAVTFGVARPGREKAGLAIWADAIDHAEKLKANGRIGEYGVVLFGPTGGNLPSGIFTLWGTEEQINDLASDRERLQLVNRTVLASENVSEVRTLRGAAIAEAMGDYNTVIDSL